MKIVSIIAVSLLVASLHGHAQKTKAKSVSLADHDEYAIPGKDYGLGFTVPPIIFGEGTPVPDPSFFEDDISIEILTDSTGISHTICPDKFIVYYHIRVNSAQPLPNAYLEVKVSTGLDGVPDQVLRLNYRDNHDNTVLGHFTIPCRSIPIVVKNRGIVRSFYIQPYSITAVTMGGYIGSGPLTLILDTNKPNNSASSMQLKTLMPPICKVPDSQKNTK